MTIRQKFLRFVYPLFNALTSLTGKNTRKISASTMPATSFYDLSITLNNGNELPFSGLKNKKVLLVNTASDCGYTRQYEGLQALQEKYQDKLIVLGFPANDFGAQEKEGDETIAAFCKVNYGVSFPITKKSTVIKNSLQNEVYRWLTDENKNGWNHVAPSWNFCKYLVDEKGNLTHFFEAGVEPMSKELKEAIGV
ncbi:MAG: glutathione peroxidase [Ferruginibacter sp.]